MRLRCMDNPRTVRRLALATALVCLPSALAVLVSWAVGLLPDVRLVAATYQTLLMAGLASVIVAALAACQVAIHNAFRAGYETGQASVFPGDPDTHPRPDEDPVLRLVEDV